MQGEPECLEYATASELVSPGYKADDVYTILPITDGDDDEVSISSFSIFDADGNDFLDIDISSDFMDGFD